MVATASMGRLARFARAAVVFAALIFGAGIAVTLPAAPAQAATTVPSSAVSWAIGKLGDTSYDANGGRCLEFVHDAYEAVGADMEEGMGTALNYWNMHYSRQHRGDTSPPVGALVFWGAHGSNTAGHVGISEGGNYVISSKERTNPGVHRFTISDRNAAGYPYLGWMTPPSLPDSTSQTYFRVRNMDSPRCLDANASTGYGNGTVVYLWDCHGGQNQDWYWDGERLRNRASGKCLDADTGSINSNGTRLQLWDCHNQNNQRWTPDFQPGPIGNRVQNRWSGRCLDADTGSINSNGSKVHLWDCHSGLNQRWFG